MPINYKKRLKQVNSKIATAERVARAAEQEMRLQRRGGKRADGTVVRPGTKGGFRAARADYERARDRVSSLRKSKSQILTDQVTSGKNSGGERSYKLGLTVGGIAIGTGVGHKMASGIESRHIASIAARNRQVRQLAKLSTKGLENLGMNKQAISQLRASARTNSRFMLGKMRGPLGLAVAGLFLAEGALSRFVLAPEARKSGNDTAADAFNAAGTASAFAATTLVGQRLVQNATPAHLPDAKAAAAIHKGQLVAQRRMTKAPVLVRALDQKGYLKNLLAKSSKTGGGMAKKLVHNGIGGKIGLGLKILGGLTALYLAVNTNRKLSAMTRTPTKDKPVKKTGPSKIVGQAGSVPSVPVSPRAGVQPPNRNPRRARAQGSKGAGSSREWVKPHQRDGQKVKGHWRKK